MMLFKLFMLTFALFVATPNALAQIAIEERRQLNFGSWIVDPAGDTLTIRPGGNARNVNSSIYNGGASRGQFRVTGPGGATISYSFGVGETLTTGSETISLQNFQTNRSNPFTLNNRGRRNVRVGADLIIPPGLNGGSFSGTYLIIFDNQ